MKKIVGLLLLVTLFVNLNAQDMNKLKPSETGYAPVNGTNIYYEIYGEGDPVVLLHGSYMTIDMNYGQLIPELAKSKQVIALEMQGHGRTADTNRPYSYAAMADDVAELLKHLDIGQASILGYSLGGTVGLEFAIRHPSVVDRLVFISSVYKYDGWEKASRDMFPTLTPEFFESTPLKAEYDRIAPDPNHWKSFVNKMIKFDSTPFDLGSENIQKLTCPILMIMGDNDGVDLHHVADMYKLLGGNQSGDINGLPESQLAIFPGNTHVSLMMRTEKLMSVITPFLDGTTVVTRKPDKH